MKTPEGLGQSPESMDFITAEWVNVLTQIDVRASVMDNHAQIFMIADAATGKFIEAKDTMHGALPEGRAALPITWVLKKGSYKATSVDLGRIMGARFSTAAATKLADAFEIANQKMKEGSGESSD